MLQKLLHKSGLYLRRHSPTVLTCIAAAGVVVTAVMTAKATPKAIALLEKAKDEKGENLTKPEAVKAAAPVYIPAALVGIATITCISGANILNKRSQASLISAYSLLDRSYKKYRKAANTVYGEDADAKIKTQMAKETYISADGYNLYYPELDTGEKSLFYDDFSERYFVSTMASVLNAEYHLNRNLTLRGDASVNEFYEFLGIDTIDFGKDIGWSIDELMSDGIMWLDFENRPVQMDDGMECYIITAAFCPDNRWLDDMC